TAHASNTADANAFDLSLLAAVTLKLFIQDAKTTHTVAAYVGPAAGVAPNQGLFSTISTPGNVITVEATSTENKANADPSLSLLTASALLPTAEVGGATQAYLGGNLVANASGLSMTANAGDNQATAETLFLGIAYVTGDGALPKAKTTHEVDA